MMGSMGLVRHYLDCSPKGVDKLVDMLCIMRLMTYKHCISGV